MYFAFPEEHYWETCPIHYSSHEVERRGEGPTLDGKFQNMFAKHLGRPVFPFQARIRGRRQAHSGIGKGDSTPLLMRDLSFGGGVNLNHFQKIVAKRRRFVYRHFVSLFSLLHLVLR